MARWLRSRALAGELCGWCGNDVDPACYWLFPPFTMKFHAEHCVEDWAAHNFSRVFWEAGWSPSTLASAPTVAAAGSTAAAARIGSR